MPAAKVCSQPACPELQPCPTHPKTAWAGSRRRSELPPDWEKRRRYVLDRDPTCQVCDDALSVEVDHIDEKRDHSYGNLQGICLGCHKAKTQREAAEARRSPA
jgi:5-methylcytosine-specific restriction endonuclease McrA